MSSEIVHISTFNLAHVCVFPGEISQAGTSRGENALGCLMNFHFRCVVEDSEDGACNF